MSEQLFRFCIVVLLTVFVVGVLVIGNRLASQLAQTAEERAQNGRYVQFDLTKVSRPGGAATVHGYESWVVDTRTGEVLSQATPR